MFVTGKPPQYFTEELQRTIGAVRVDAEGRVIGTGKKYEAYRLLYNESAYATGQANLQAYRDDELEEYEIIATLDLKTSEICREHDGKHYPVYKAVTGENYPPFHVNCRTTTAPYIKGLHSSRMARDPVTGKSMRTTARDYKEWRAQMEEKYSEGRKEYEKLQVVGLKGVPDIDIFQKERYNNSPVYQKLMRRYQNIHNPLRWQAVEFNPGTLVSHFEKHGTNLGLDSKAQYERAALHFLNQTTEKETLIAADGVRRFYSATTNEFASVYPDGRISTYFKPSQGIKYWERQVKKHGTD